MKKLFVTLQILFWGNLFSLSAHAQLFINEIVSSNTSASGFADEDGQYSDWFEIYNSSGSPINIGGYHLSDKVDQPTQFVIPAGVTVPANGFLVMWASSKAAVGKPLHTNFGLSKGGDYVGLYNSAGTLIDGKAFGPMSDNISFGRNPNGGPDFSYYSTPTPGATNANGVVQLIKLAPPTFSHQTGFHTAGFNLSISHIEAGVSIWYTLDGSEPVNNATPVSWNYKNFYNEAGTSAQATVVKGVDDGLLTAQHQSIAWVNPIPIIDRTVEANKVSMKSSSVTFTAPYLPSYNVYKGTTIRAKAFKEGFAPSDIATGTFFVNPGGVKYPVPVVSVVSNERSFFDYTSGMYTAGRAFDVIRVTHPTGAASICTDANFTGNGAAWERSGNVEFFDNGAVVNQPIDFRIHGGCSRSLPEKTLRLYSNTEFNFAVFPEAPTRYPKRLLLRNSGNDNPSTMFRDSYFTRLLKSLTVDTQLSRPSVVFLNSEYWGIHNLRERFDKYYLQKKYGLDPDQVDLMNVENNEVEEGDNVSYNALNTFVSNNTFTGSTNYNTLKTMIDIVNFTDYMIAEIFVGNQDWPHKNMRLWRHKLPNTDINAPFGHDGKWRWMLYDTDLGLAFENSVNDNFFARARGIVGGGGPVASMFNKILENEEYKAYFLTRLADLLNTTFLAARTQSMLADLKAVYQPIMPDHIARWKAPATMTEWDANVAVVNNFMGDRPNTYRTHVRESFGGGYLNRSVTVDVSDAAHGYVKVNTVDILPTADGVSATPYPWTGTYFQTLTMTLTAVAKPGNHFVRWEDGAGTSVGSTEVFTFPVGANSYSYKAIFASGALPVVLTRFEAKKKDSRVHIAWTTTSEKNNDYFVVERSRTAQDWEVVATVKGAATTNNMSKYSAVDELPLPGLSYYRLKQVDFDGTTTYSRMVPVNMGEFMISNVWPNPVSDVLTITADLPLADAEYEITDMHGRTRKGYQKVNMTKTGTIPVGHLETGIYILNIRTKTGHAQSRFLKQ